MNTVKFSAFAMAAQRRFIFRDDEKTKEAGLKDQRYMEE